MKTLFISIDEFIKAGGVMTPGMNVYREERRHFDAKEFEDNMLLKSSLFMGEFVKKEEETGMFILKNETFKSLPINPILGFVKINFEINCK